MKMTWVYIVLPLVEVEDNMREVQKRDALPQGKFYFRRNLFPHLEPHGGPSAHYRECELMDSNTIFNGMVRERDSLRMTGDDLPPLSCP